MSRGIAYGSADGPRMIYGRENVNWGGPKKAGDIDNINDNPMDDYGDDHTEIKTDIETQIEDLQELYPEDEMLQKYGKLTDHFAVQQSLRSLHELFPFAALDNDTSPLRAGKVDFTKGSIWSGIQSDVYIKGSRFFYSKLGTLDTEDVLTRFPHKLERVSKNMKDGALKRKFDSIKDQINDPSVDTFDVLEQCIEHIEKPFRTSAQAEYAVLDSFMSSVQPRRKKKEEYSLEEAKQEIQNYREKNDNIYAFNVPAHMEDRISQISEITRNQFMFPSSMQDRLSELYGNFVENMQIVSPLYGDNPELDKKLDNVIGKIVDQFENDLYYEMLVKDHVDANRIAEYYGIDSEYDNWEAGEYSISMFPGYGRSFGLDNDTYYRDKVKEGDIRCIIDIMRQNTPPPLEERVLDSDKMDGSALIDFCNNKFFKTKDDYKNAVNYTQEILNQEKRRFNFSKADPIKVSVFSNRLGNNAHSLIEESFKEAKRNDNDDTWKKYEDFVQEVERLEKFPSNGLRSNVQKTVIIKKLHSEIMQGNQEGMGYLSDTPANTDSIAEQLYRDSTKDNITEDKLSAIDDLI